MTHRLSCKYSFQSIFVANSFNPQKKQIPLLNTASCSQSMQRTWQPVASIIIAIAQRWSNVPFNDRFPVILHKKKWFSIVYLFIIWSWLHASAMKLCLLYIYQNWSIFLHLEREESVLCIPSDTVTQNSYVYDRAILRHFVSDMAILFS